MGNDLLTKEERQSISATEALERLQKRNWMLREDKFYLDKEKVDFALRYLSVGGSVDGICAAIGIKPARWNEALKEGELAFEIAPERRDPEQSALAYLYISSKTCQSELEAKLLSNILKASEYDWKASDRLLRIINPMRYGVRELPRYGSEEGEAKVSAIEVRYIDPEEGNGRVKAIEGELGLSDDPAEDPIDEESDD